MSSQSRSSKIERLLMSSEAAMASTTSSSPRKFGPRKKKHNAEGKVFIVERILKYKQWKGVRYARVKWLGYHETTWEPANAIFDFTSECASKMTPKRRPKSKKVAESLVGRRKIRGIVEYKVHWKGLPSIFDKWIRESSLKRPDLIASFLKKNNKDISVKTLRLIPSPKQVKIRDKSETKSAVLDPGAEFGIPEPLPVSDDVQSPREEDNFSSMIAEFPEALPAPLVDSGLKTKTPTGHTPLVVKISKQAVKNSENHDGRSPSVISVLPSLRGFAELSDSQGNKYRFIDDKPMREWTVLETYEYILQRGFPEEAKIAQTREITGAQLLEHLEPAALKEFLTIRLGPSLKIVKLLKALKATKPNVTLVGVDSVESMIVDSEPTRL